MPYVTYNRREAIASGDPVLTPGELNYALTVEILSYLDGCPPGYASLNEVIGVLECVKQELYRRVVVPYEISKMEDNGDVF